MLRLSVIVPIFLCALTTASLAGPQSYCDPFARDAANRKTGQADVVIATIGGPAAVENGAAQSPAGAGTEWQKAYEASFGACMSNFAPQAAAATNKRPAMVKHAVPKAAAVKREFPDGAEVSLPRRTHDSRTKNVTKVASKAKPARRHTAEPAAIQDPAIESTADAPAVVTNISTKSPGNRRARKDEVQNAHDPQHCTNLACWFKQRRAKPQ